MALALGASGSAVSTPAPDPVAEIDSERPGGDPSAVEDRDDRRRPAPPTEPLFQTSGRATRLLLDVAYPPRGAVVGGSVCGVFVAGSARAIPGDLGGFEVALVIDTSESTADPSGSDIDGDGVLGRPQLEETGARFARGSTDPGDSILAAEVAAARQVLGDLDRRSARVTVVTFAGGVGGTRTGFFRVGSPEAAISRVPLTNDFERVERVLDEILATEPAGGTDIAAGIDRATEELLGGDRGSPSSDRRSERVVLFFTDGQPTLPHGPDSEADNVRAVFHAAARANRSEIRIHSFAIGPEALEWPIASVEMALLTGGTFMPVRHPGDLVERVQGLSLADLHGLELRNLTTDETATRIRATTDGTWSAFVRLVPGMNRIAVRATATDGTAADELIEVRMDSGAPSPPLPPDLSIERERLLEDCLRGARRRRLAAEADRVEQVREELRLEIERERDRARERAEEQRKRLDLRVEPRP